MKRSMLIILCCIWSKGLLYADSPLTSITFYTLYWDNNIIVKSKNEAILNDNSCKFLSSPSVNNGEKIALINALGWKFEGQNNAKIYADFLKIKYKSKKTLSLSKLSASELMCMAYLTAMDDYLHPQNALPYIDKAIAIEGNSLSLHLIHTLLEAQIHSEDDWCAVWKSYEKLHEEQANYVQDVKSEVLIRVEEYLILYKSSCR